MKAFMTGVLVTALIFITYNLVISKKAEIPQGQSLLTRIEEIKNATDPKVQKELSEKLFMMILAQIGLKAHEIFPQQQVEFKKECPQQEAEIRYVDKVVEKVVEKASCPKNSQVLKDFQRIQAGMSSKAFLQGKLSSSKVEKLINESSLISKLDLIWKGKKVFELMPKNYSDDRQRLEITLNYEQKFKYITGETLIEFKSQYKGLIASEKSSGVNKLIFILPGKHKIISFYFGDYLATFNTFFEGEYKGTLYKKNKGSNRWNYIGKLIEQD